ncbi:hypothetical protein [Paraburkholderia sp. MM5477-R1]|uniref:hypothetical protein n=1 Tax=Paraburkholderia sp. MM5477-R1 TaxID=2991062 RepID=UPI003D227EDD
MSTSVGVAPVGEASTVGHKGLDARTPLLLLPVNVQTRFVDPVRGDPELWVRLYPDQIAVNSHEPELTDQEVAAGQAYWNAAWAAGKPAAKIDDVKAPWRTLVGRYGAPRAAWIALQMTPTNTAQQPAAPTPSGGTPVPPPVFPVPPSRKSSWEKPAVADCLPDAWTVMLFSGTQTGTFRGSPIQTPLAVSLTPPAAALPAGSPVDPGLQWMVDFNAAVTAGMALKIPLTAAQRSGGFDRILVYGVRAGDPNASQTFADLLTAHHYTDGFALVPQGSPTNNTPDASSAFGRKDPDAELSFKVERQDALTSNPDCDGLRFTSLIGVPTGIVDHVAYADGTNEASAADMMRSLWPATLGYFLTQMMADVFTAEVIEEARQYVLANAVPRGPIPAFRVGQTPYGVLPVTSLAHYRPNPDLAGPIEPNITSFLQKLWPNWLSSANGAPHMQRGGDPDQNLMSVLGMDASSMTFQGRQVLGADFMWNLFNFLGEPKEFQNKWFLDYALFGRFLLDRYGFNQWNPRLLQLGFAQDSFPVNLPTVQDGPLSETDALKADADLGGGKKGNYIDWLRAASVPDLQQENYPGTKPTALLYKILRQSLLFDYANLPTIAEVTAGRLMAEQVRESEIISVQPSTASLTPLQVLARPSIPNPQISWAEYVMTTNFGAQSPFAQLNDLRASLANLSKLPTAELDRLLTETLDACSHRLDVWATSIAHALLKRTRDAQNSGVHLGCYAWLEDIRPETGRAPVQGVELEKVRALDAFRKQVGLNVPLQPLSDGGGYIHAPSQTQAAAAAVLRSGYMTHTQTAEEGLLSIDLSSERVRRALLLVEGVQEGQSLNALLGYLFEDALHAQALNTYIQPFRDAYPVVGSKLTPSSAPNESVAASNVVDGLALRTAWDGGKLPTGQNWGNGLPDAGADQNAVIAVLQTLDDYADALGDLSIAEAVFQVMRGNFGRGGGLMDAISRGSRPPKPDIVDTPRGGIDMTHRVELLFAGDPTPDPAWSGVTVRPRAAAEPWLDAWLGSVLADPAIVRCEVQYDSGGASNSQLVSVLDLDVGPLDLLAMSDAAEVPQRSELENRVLFAASLPADAAKVQIVFQSSALPPNSILFPDMLFVAQKLRGLIGAARTLTPQDMAPPETDAGKAGGTIDLAELQTRAKAAVKALGDDVAALTTAIAALPGAPDPVRQALLKCSFYGATGSIPLTSTGADAGLGGQAQGVLKVLQARLTKASAVVIATAPVADLLDLFNSIFGDLVVLPRFKAPNLPDLQTAFGQSASLIASDPVAPDRWLRQLTHVRPAVSRLDLALCSAQAFGEKSLYPPELLLGQMPSPPAAAPPDRWLALPLDPSNVPQKGRIAFACLAVGDPTTESSCAGLLIDEWNERIPSTQENAAVAFHFKEASGRAPQALLLAVCPDQRELWDEGLLQMILLETLELAKIRTVDLASVEQVGQILPALYFALNLQGATFSTRFFMEKGNLL